MTNMEEKKSILLVLIEQYGLKCVDNESLVTSIENYSYVYRVVSEIAGYIVKKLSYSKQRFDSLNQAFHKLKTLDFVEKPIKTLNEEYLSKYKDFMYIVFHMIDEIEVLPSATWWGETIAQIQKVDKSDVDGISINSQWIETGKSLFSSAKPFLDENISDKIAFMFQDAFVGLKEIDHYPSCFLHGDLSEGNVLIDNQEYRIIDFDRFGVGPKEYDLQRLIWMKMEHEKSFEKMEVFVKELIISYEKCGMELVDRKLLWYLMEMDFVQAFCWLNIVVRDPERGDREGNLVMLTHYISIIRQGGFDIIRKILTKNEKDAYGLSQG